MDRMSGPETEFEGYALPEGPPDRDWGWPGYDIEIPDSWSSGVYIASLEEVGSRQAPLPKSPVGSRDSAEILFVVRPAPGKGEATPLLYKVPWFTYQAYNATGYGSLYAEAGWRQRRDKQGFCVTTRRPGGGAGGTVMPGDSPDFYVTTSPRQTFAHWDQKFITWLEAAEPGNVEYCTDWDLHLDSSWLKRHKAVISVGHDEYWSEPLREALESFVNQGGNIAFLSGNICGWRVDLTDDGALMWCAKRTVRDKWRTHGDRWQDVYPETGVTGVSFFQGGGWWDGRRTDAGYRVQHSEHWAFSGVELEEGALLRSSTDVPLIGYEADGCEVVERRGAVLPLAQGGCACLVEDEPTARNAVPERFAILGYAAVGEGWHRASLGSVVAMSTYTTASGGIVFQAATTDWALSMGRGGAVAKVTENVLSRLKLASLAIIGPLPTIGGESHAVEGTSTQFAVDASMFSDAALRETKFRWTVSGLGSAPEGPAIKIDIPYGAGLMTVTVSALRPGCEERFGSVTFPVLSREEGLRLKAVALLREIVMPGDPSMPLVDPRAPLLGLAREINTVNMHWMKERGVALIETLGQLIEHIEGLPDGQRAPG